MKYRLSKKEQKTGIRIIASLIAFVAVFTIDKCIDLASSVGGKLGWLLPFFLYLAIYATIGYDVIFRAVRNIAHGQIFDENFLMVVATVGAFALAIFRGATGQKIEGFDEACAVLLFYQIGEFFQRYATGKSRKSISSLMDIRPDVAHVLRDGETVDVYPDEVQVGETIIVNPGEKIPLDGICVLGDTSVDLKALTGESLPCAVAEGGNVISGSVNLTDRIQVLVQKEFHDSTVSKILELVENASDKKSKAENFITKFARYYTPTVVLCALLLAIIPGAITNNWSAWIYRALSFLVVSCPCALVISIPLSFFAGLGAASRDGILIKGSNYLEKLSKANIFVFDKTGTLTKGDFAVSGVFPAERREEALRLAAICEQGLSHPIAVSITKRYIEDYGDEIPDGYAIKNESGLGVIATLGDEIILTGNQKLMSAHGVQTQEYSGAGTAVYVAKNGEYVGQIVIEDELKQSSPALIAELNGMGCRTVMLTGDSELTAQKVAQSVGISEYRASLLPQDKVNAVEQMLAAKSKHDELCFVGDGINDAPVLMRSDIGIAMGGVGSDAAIEASDIVLMQDDLMGIPAAKRLAKRTMGIVTQNIAFSLAVKAAILVLSALGITNMWIAVFGDVGVAILAILNAMRVGMTKHKKDKSDPKTD